MDLGSGFGRAVLYTAAFYSFTRVVGVEVDLHRHILAARAFHECPAVDVNPVAAGDADDESLPVRGRGQREPMEGRVYDTTFRLVCEDAVKDPRSWVTADVLYVCCTCFSDELLAQVSAHIPKLRRGAVVVSGPFFKASPGRQ